MPFSKTSVSLRWLILLCLLVLALSGCGLLPDLKEPEVSVSDIQIKKTGQDYTVVVSLRVMNPNDMRIDIQGISCGLALNVKDKTFVQGAATKAFTLKPNSSVEVPVKLPSLTADTASDLVHILWSCITEGEPAICALKGRLKMEVPLLPGAVNVSFSCTGSLQPSMQDKAIHYNYNLKGALKASHLGSVKVPLSSTGALQLSIQDQTIYYDLGGTQKVKYPFPLGSKKWSFSVADDIPINKLVGGLVSDIQIKTTNGLAIDILLRFPPTAWAADIQNITCGLSLKVKDKIFTQGAATSAFMVEPNGSINVPVKIPNLSADAASDLAYILWAVFEGEPAIYALEGALTVKVPHLGPVDVPFSCTGPLQLSMKDNIMHYDLGSTLTVHVQPVEHIIGEIPMGKLTVSAHDIPEWFEPNVYLTNKLHQLGDGWTWDSMIQELNKAGYVGDEGYYRHFLERGNRENVSPNKYFDAEYYFNRKLDRLQREDPAGNWSLESIKKSFEKDGLSAWDHYTRHGMNEGLDPCRDFSTTKYLEAKLSSLQSADPNWTREKMIRAFQAANLNPVAHYSMYGVHENLSYSPNGSKSK